MSSMPGDMCISQVADNACQMVKQNMSSSEEKSEYTSNVSYASAMTTMSTATTTSSKSKYLMHSQQIQASQSSHVFQSSSAKTSAESQSLTMYQSQTSPPVQKSFENPVDKIDQFKEKTEAQTTVSSSEFMVTKESESITTFATTENEQNTNSNLIVTKANNEKVNDKPVSEEKNLGAVTSSDTSNKMSETLVADISAKGNQSNEDQQLQEKEIPEKSLKNTLNENALASHERTVSKESATVCKNIKKESVGEKVVQFNTNVKEITPAINSGPEMPLVEALTIVPDRPYSPLTTNLSNPAQSISEPIPVPNEPEIPTNINNSVEKREVQLPSAPSPVFTQQTKRGITPIPPIKPYNPPESKDTPIPMPPETKPYIPPDFKINIEPRMPREETSSPLIDALTTAPNRPFTPIQTQNIERGSLREALTIAPERPYSPLPLNTGTQSNYSHYTSTSAVQVQSTSTEIIRPIATQTTTQHTNDFHSEFSSMQNTHQLQSLSNMSAFKPVAKQVFPPPQPEQSCKLATFPPISDELKTSFEKSTRTKQDMLLTESKVAQQSVVTTSSISTASQGYSSVKSAQQFFETLDQRESFSSTAVRSKSGLQKPDKIPPYQKHFEQLPSQRGITPEICNAPAVFQRPVTPTTEPPRKSREKSQEPKSFTSSVSLETTTSKPSVKTPVQPLHTQFQRTTPISMTFQPVTDENFYRASPARSSRPTTPSLINKPAPIIPHYQMNLVTVEHTAPECHLYDPSSREGSRSPTPRLRSKSPAQGPPPNPLKAQAPRLKESTPQRQSGHTLLTQATSNLRKEHEMSQKDMRINSGEILNTVSSWAQNQPMIEEQRHSNIGYKSESYKKQDMNIKEDSMINQNYGQRKMQSQNVTEYGNTTVQTTRKTIEEFERTQSAKTIEIRTGGSSSSAGYTQIDSNVRPTSINPKQVFPPPIMSMPATQQVSSLNLTNESLVNASRTIESCQPNPSISGANQGPECDPTPSTGSSVGAAARGKTFGVSSAPKRGRGVLNKAALPGSRVPLCASCNGNIRGPFITALGRIWCPEHFICVNASCRRPLQDIGFVEENGQLYCEYCFEQYIAPACDKCHAKIKGDCLNAIGKHFHPECFNCVYCGKLFGNNPFFLEDGLPYCEADWNELFTTKCYACGFPVEAGDRWVEALNNNYHSQCFNCTVCKKNLEGQSFFAKGGRPFSPETPSPQRTRKLETPLHFDGGLFSDIRSKDGKLLSKVTVDRLHSSTRHDITDSPSVFESIGSHGNRDYVNDVVKTETITNEDVIKVKFTPVPPEIDSPRLLTPSQFHVSKTKTPVEYLKDDYEDLQSYKIVSSLCKEKQFETDITKIKEKSFDHMVASEPLKRSHSPLANFLVPKQMTKIDTYLQESLDACLPSEDRKLITPIHVKLEGDTTLESKETLKRETKEETYTMESFGSYQVERKVNTYQTVSEVTHNPDISAKPTDEIVSKNIIKINSVKENQGVLRAIYNMPIHYHAAILCFILIVYNLIFQYIKKNCHGQK
ncbi:unnamed protein product [Chilo suppressalis]|uniref:LIM zinc-binding domain-containing protein n=1 Tax=Chilo suppressalis TaxID=168631 RepID=A0ABN8BHZ0_CHISP|nr:unnamed protein product [Chilo suppressalis]